MPVVEPYGISEPMATSGKINLNYQIAPFTYITRNTGIRALFKAVDITALNPVGGAKLVGTIKSCIPNPPGTNSAGGNSFRGNALCD